MCMYYLAQAQAPAGAVTTTNGNISNGIASTGIATNGSTASAASSSSGVLADTGETSPLQGDTGGGQGVAQRQQQQQSDLPQVQVCLLVIHITVCFVALLRTALCV